MRMEERVAAASAGIDAARAAAWPALHVSSGISRVSELARLDLGRLTGMPGGIDIGVRDTYDFAAAVSMPVFTGFRTKNEIRAAEERRMQALGETALLRDAVLHGVHRLYRALEGNLHEQEALASSVRRIDSHLQLARRLLRQGQASAYDTLEVSGRLLETKTALARLVRRFRATAAELAALVDLPAVDSIETTGDVEASLDLAPLDEHLARALACRPELALREHAIREKEFLRAAAASAWWPQVRAGASWHYARPGVDFFSEDWMDYYSLSVELRWEVWNRGRRANEIRRIDHAVRMSRIERESAAADVRREVVAAWEEVAGAREQLLMQRRLVAQERERYRIVLERYGEGLATSYDLRDAEESLTSAEVRLRRDRIDLLAGRATLARATGRIDPRHGG